MKAIGLVIVMSFFSCLVVYGQTFKTAPVSNEIHTIQVNRNGDWQNDPVIRLNNNEFIRLNFDRISDNSFARLRYRLIYCNADWSRSNLFDIEFLDGFNDNLITDNASSMNTTVQYTNFILDIPNRDVRLRISGNYVIQVYEESNPGNILLNACFSVLDSRVSVTGSVSSNTLIDSNREHQQVSFAINHPSLRIRNPINDLKIYLRQNNRLDNQRVVERPSSILPNRLVFEQRRELIFEAGNEYRRFDIPSSRFNGLRIMRMAYNRPYFFASIIPDIIRANTRYVFDEDQNGRFWIRNVDGTDSDTDGDYFFVNYTLRADYPFKGNVYINGGFTNNRFDETYRMQYDYEKGEYYATILMKQGSYNYQYMVADGDSFSAAPIEGNYFETENSYQILVYYRPPGQLFDALIGYLHIGR